MLKLRGINGVATHTGMFWHLFSSMSSCMGGCTQDTVQEMAKNMKSSTTGAIQASAAELYDFMKRVSTVSCSFQ